NFQSPNSLLCFAEGMGMGRLNKFLTIKHRSKYIQSLLASAEIKVFHIIVQRSNPLPDLNQHLCKNVSSG
ncbi:MAG: hypothetical protein Q8M67_02240, partial [Bacteroidota bacterium]|nr:hypothetical protein [Bacteroidota bacterium]